MVKRLVTQDMVNQAASALVRSGVSAPSIVQVRAQLGVGSFSTIRPLLTVWEEEQQRLAVAAQTIPDELTAKAEHFVRLAWALARAEANKAVEAAHSRAAAGIGLAHRQLTEANGEISRPEALTSRLEDRLVGTESALRDVEIALAESLDGDATDSGVEGGTERS